MLAVLGEMLKAQLAPDLVEAEPHFKAAPAGQDAFHYDEPAPIPWSVRELYGAALLAAGRAVEAEQVFRADLGRNARSGRSLFGLMSSLQAQGRKDEAALVKTGYQNAWRLATGPMTVHAFR